MILAMASRASAADAGVRGIAVVTPRTVSERLSRWACSSAIPRSAWACESTSRLLTSAPSPLPKSTLPSSSVAWM